MEGGCFIGIGEPSATDGYDTFFRLAQVLGVDKDNGARVCHGKWEYEVKAQQNHILDILEWPVMEHIYLTDEKQRYWQRLQVDIRVLPDTSLEKEVEFI